jgi:hypothetical protein
MRCAAVVAAVLVLAPAGAGARVRFHYTHRVVVTGQLVDHWTVDDPEDCGPVGDGTLTVNFRSAKPSKAQPAIDPAYAPQGNGRLGSWGLFAIVDSFGHVGALPPKPAIGTIDLVDNTVPRPSYDGSDCGAEIERSACGSHPLTSGARVVASGWDRRFITVDFYEQLNSFGPCHIGLVEGFSLPPRSAGGTHGHLLLRMPRAAKLRSHKVVQVTGSSHKRSSYGSRTSDVTRTATVTFTRLG